MRLSARTEYGILALLDLADQARRSPVQSHDIATRQGIPEPYLNQLLTTLRKAGLVISRRGPGGGHQLAKLPSEITLAEIFLALEGDVWSELRTEGRGSRSQALRLVWSEVERATRSVLEKVTLTELIDRERDSIISYQI